MTNLILFFKADQFDLFDAPVNVKAGVRGGKTVKPYTRVQKVAQKHPDKAARDAADLAYAKHGYDGQPDPDHAAMQRYAQGVREEEARVLKSPEHKAMVAQSEAEVAKMRADREPTIVGHSWEDIQRAQQRGSLNRRIDTSKPPPPVTLTDDDKALLEKHGVEGLAAMGFHGTLDRYHRVTAAAKKTFDDALAARRKSGTSADEPAKMVVFPKEPKPETRYKHHLIRRTRTKGADLYTVFGEEKNRGRRKIATFSSVELAKKHVDTLQDHEAAKAKKGTDSLAGKPLAASHTLAGLTKLINEYYFSDDFTIDPETLTLQRPSKAPPQNVRIVKGPGMYRFEAT
jgi:hypothetical protein